MLAAAVAGFQVIEASAAAICAYVPLKPSFDEEYEVYPEIKVVLPLVAANDPFETSTFVVASTNFTVA
jgi:hypothetical protein